jgi:uncharacterized protein with PQ loop repeat
MYRPTFYRIYKNKSTQGFQSAPYVVALFSAMLWIYYALLKSNEFLLITINSAGCVIETLYIIMYLLYAPKKAKVRRCRGCYFGVGRASSSMPAFYSRTYMQLFTAKILLLLNVGVFGLILLLTLLLSTGIYIAAFVCNVHLSTYVRRLRSFSYACCSVRWCAQGAWSSCPSRSRSPSPSAPLSGSSTACLSRTNTSP